MPRRAQLLATAAAIVAVVVLLTLVPLGRWLAPVVDWIAQAGLMGMLVFALLYLLATVLLLPGSVLSLAAGFAYGPYQGTLLVSPVSLLAASLAFVIAGRIKHRRIALLVENNPRLRTLQKSVQDKGFAVVVLLRLSPLVPYSILNYALGLSRLKFKDFFLGSFIGMLPGTVMYVYLGSLVSTGSDLAQGAQGGGSMQEAIYWGGLAATLAAMLLITRLVRSSLAAIPALESLGGDAESIE